MLELQFHSAQRMFCEYWNNYELFVERKGSSFFFSIQIYILLCWCFERRTILKTCDIQIGINNLFHSYLKTKDIFITRELDYARNKRLFIYQFKDYYRSFAILSEKVILKFLLRQTISRPLLSNLDISNSLQDPERNSSCLTWTAYITIWMWWCFCFIYGTISDLHHSSKVSIDYSSLHMRWLWLRLHWWSMMMMKRNYLKYRL